MRESETVEFKETTKELKQAAISISAMLNKHGHGTVYFGIDNSGSVCRRMIIGENTTRDVSVMIRDNIRPAVTPTITVEDLDGSKIIKVTAEGSDAPYSAFGRYYIRSDDEDLILDPSQLRSFFERTGNERDRWELRPSGHFINCIDERLLIDYTSQCNETGRLSYVYTDMRSVLSKLGLLFKEDELNNAGYYLFSDKKPLRLKLAVFNTDERLSFADIRQFDGNIFECIEEGIRYIKSNMHWSAEIIGFRRVETPEIPLEAIREIVINSFAHMKYGMQPYNEISFTPRKIRISNPGSLPEGKTPMSFADGSMPSVLRNPIIANVLYLNGSIDAFGTGFHRVFTACRNAHIQYSFSLADWGFTFEFIRNGNVTTTDPTHGTENQIDMQIMDLISDDPSINIEKMTETLGVSKAVIQAAINRLKSKGVVMREGSRKTGKWIIVR